MKHYRAERNHQGLGNWLIDSSYEDDDVDHDLTLPVTRVSANQHHWRLRFETTDPC